MKLIIEKKTSSQVVFKIVECGPCSHLGGCRGS